MDTATILNAWQNNVYFYLYDAGYTLFIRKCFFQPSTETFLTFQYHNFLRTFLAKFLSSTVLGFSINGK